MVEMMQLVQHVKHLEKMQMYRTKTREQELKKTTPESKGIQVTGLISCSRSFQMLVVPEAPFSPSS